MGVNVTTTHSTEIRIPVANATVAGDLLINVEGVATKPVPDATMAQLNNSTLGLSVVHPITNQGTYLGDSITNSAFKWFCEAGNGSVLMVYSGNGTSNYTDTVSLLGKNTNGANLWPTVTVTSASNCTTPRIKRLTNDTVVIAWAEGTALKFAIHNNDGTVAVAAATVATLLNVGGNFWNMAVLAGGDIVFAYAKVTSSNAVFSRYNSSGVLQGAETVIEASGNPRALCVQSLSAGGFVCYYTNITANATKFARYDASGTIQGSLTTVSTGTAVQMQGEFDGLMLELPGGNLVFQWGVSGGSHNYSVYTSAGAFVVTVATLATGFAKSDVVQGLAQTMSGGFVAVTFGSNGTPATFRSFDASGKLRISTTFTMYGYGDAPGGPCLVTPSATGFCVYSIRVVYTDPTTDYSAQLAKITGEGVLVGSVVTLQTFASYFLSQNTLAIHSCGYALVGYRVSSGTGTLNFAVYNPNRSSILGVALESVAAGATCRVATKGTYPINQSLLAAGSYDQRTATVPGTKGAIVGYTAMLYGME